MYVVSWGISSWQGKNWDPEINDPSFDRYCGNITSDKVIYPQTKKLKSTVQKLLKKGGYGSEVSTLTTPMLNWIGWLADYAVDGCEETQDQCFSTHNSTYYAQDDITQDWRAWPYQVSILRISLQHWLMECSTALNGDTSKPGPEFLRTSSPSSPASALSNSSP